MTELTDEHIEALLRKYQPLDGPPAAREQPRVWPWAAAAAALLAIAVTMHGTIGAPRTESIVRASQSGAAEDLSISDPTVAEWLEHTRAAEQRRTESAWARASEADAWR